MHPPRPFVPTAFVFSALTVLALAGPSVPGKRGGGGDWEVRRAQGHLDSVLVELRGRDVSTLAAGQRARRAMLIGALQAYRDRGLFPHNYDFPTRPTPYFVDRKTGTRCAVAHLLSLTGRDDLVHRVARANNNAYVADLAGDAAFSDWLAANGLTFAEAERIQIVYAGSPTQSRAMKTTNVALKALGWTAGAGSVVSSIWNASTNSNGERVLGNRLGLASGIVSMGMGFAMLAQHPAQKLPAQLSVGVGMVSLALATEAMLQRRFIQSAQHKVEASIAPLLAAGHGAGVEVAIRF